MRASRPSLLAIALAVLAGCGRGGSSGLDIANENRVIDSALRQRRCQSFRGLTICPADASGAAGNPRVDTDLANATAIDCFQATPGGACAFTLVFTPRSFAAGTTFKALGRSDAVGSPWILGADPMPSGGASMTATLALGAGGPPPRVQLAVLAFAAMSPSPGEVDQLHDTAASYAFVTRVLKVNVVTPTATPTPTGRATNTATATRTPGAGDCCQCETSCAEPMNGSCGACAVVFAATCFGQSLCTARTPTPTVSPTVPAATCFADNGDGTISDRCSGLTWEKKEAADGPHDYVDRYPWAGVCNHALRTLCQPDAAAAAACSAAADTAAGCAECPSGMLCIAGDLSDSGHPTTTVWTWLVQLNQVPGFAGHTDWRLPSVDQDGGSPELETLLAPVCGAGTCVDPGFDIHCEVGALCGSGHACSDGSTCVRRPDLANPVCEGNCTLASCSCTWPQFYWSQVSAASDDDNAWSVDFSNGSIGVDRKIFLAAVRAVRGQVTPKPTPTPGLPPTSTPTPTTCLHDNGDGTVSDNCRGLRWEKKDRAGGLHDVSAIYTWAGSCSDQAALCQPNANAAATCAATTGGAAGCATCASGSCVVDPDRSGAVTTIWEWINQLNATTFAGFNDWRIPTVGFQGDAAELETLCTSGGSVPSAFDDHCTNGCTVETCSCTQATLQDYWSATSISFEPGLADGVSFVFCGSVGAGPKTNANSIRAVRSE